MGRKIRITEKQYKKILEEGVLVGSNQKFTVNAQEIGNTPEEKVTNTMRDLKQKYPDADKNFEVVSPNKDNKTQTVSKPNTNTSNNNNISVMENKLITKKQLQESRLKALKENSEVYTVKDFIKKFNN